MSAPPPSKTNRWSWRSQAFRGLVYQVIAVAAIGLMVWLLAHNTLENMRVRGIQSGFDFLTGPAGFDIGELLIPYESVDPYWKAFLVGVLNTLRVAIIGIVLTTLLGTLIGIGRFSNNAIVRGLCYAYVELFRNVPVLLQLLVWFWQRGRFDIDERYLGLIGHTLYLGALAALFTEARSQNGWLDEPVGESLLQELYEITRMGPTSMNCQPARFAFLTTEAAKATRNM